MIAGKGEVGVVTDDRGIYRLTNLPPGDYIVSATELNTRNAGSDGYEGVSFGAMRQALSFTYYPSESKTTSAVEINLAPGQEIKDIDIALLDRGEHMVSGSVIASGDRLPIKNATVSVTLNDRSTTVSLATSVVSTQTDDQGLWTLTEIPDGDYSLQVVPGAEPETNEPSDVSTRPGGSDFRETKYVKKLVDRTQRVTVSGVDITGVVIELGKGAKITGKVSVEAGKELPVPLSVSVENGNVGNEFSAYQAYGYVGENGNFEIDGITPGQNNIDVNIRAQPGWYVKRISVGGKDVKGVPITVVEGQQLTGVEIVLSSESAIATVHVADALKNSAVSGVPVCMVISDPAMWRYTNEYLCGISDGAGTFQISGAPGTYLALVPGLGESRNIITPEYVKLHAAAAQSFVLKAGAENQIQLSVSR